MQLHGYLSYFSLCHNLVFYCTFKSAVVATNNNSCCFQSACRKWNISSWFKYQILKLILINFQAVNSVERYISMYILLYILHCGFLEHWNSQKSVSNIWPHFSCLLDEGIPKIWKKLNFHDGFLSYLQNNTANSAHLAFLPCLSLPSESHCENSISSIFLESPHQVDVKNIVKCWKDFFVFQHSRNIMWLKVR